MRITILLRQAAARLAAAGIESPRVDAELLAAHVLGVSRGQLIVVDVMPSGKQAQFERLIEVRSQRVPLQHLTGVAPFLDLELKVGPGVFIPRPETELLARWAIDQLAGIDRPTVIDLCSGSGALALALHEAWPQARVIAVERSPAALEWLRRNVAGTTVLMKAGDVRDVDLPEGVDLVVSNPPYVPLSSPVSTEVGADPPEAVFAGEDGLDLIPALIDRAAGLLRPGGRLGFEHDESHTELAKLLEPDFVDILSHTDLAGRPRFTTATRRT